MRVYVLGNKHNANFLATDLVTSLGITDIPKTRAKYPLPDLLLFTGGQDISPALYGRDYPFIHATKLRDHWEVSWFNWAIKNNVPMFGICRGMQLFTALTGGELIPHVENHVSSHKVFTPLFGGNTFTVNSIHHQMCVPNTDVEVLAFASNVAFNDNTKEPEALWFPKINALGVQWHPEMMSNDSTAGLFVQKIIDKYLLLNIRSNR